jgi:hypothetical protein
MSLKSTFALSQCERAVTSLKIKTGERLLRLANLETRAAAARGNTAAERPLTQ